MAGAYERLVTAATHRKTLLPSPGAHSSGKQKVETSKEHEREEVAQADTIFFNEKPIFFRVSIQIKFVVPGLDEYMVPG